RAESQALAGGLARHPPPALALVCQEWRVGPRPPADEGSPLQLRPPPADVVAELSAAGPQRDAFWDDHVERRPQPCRAGPPGRDVWVPGPRGPAPRRAVQARLLSPHGPRLVPNNATLRALLPPDDDDADARADAHANHLARLSHGSARDQRDAARDDQTRQQA